jgi:formylglycine-generating enzyme required for sulfatase activity
MIEFQDPALDKLIRDVCEQNYFQYQGHTFVIVDAGDFLMGSPESEPQRGTDEGLHSRRIGRRYAISTKEVTKEQFLRFQTKFSEVRPSPEPDCPIGGVLWHEAAAYCNWLNEQEGIQKDQWCYETNEQGQYAEGMRIRGNYLELVGYRLPTEAEFEFAARGGLSGKTYVWGDEFRPNGNWMANTWQGKFPVKDAGEDGFAGIAPVKSFPPNGYGLYDMAGNVWEWCSDWYRPDYYEQLAKAGGVAMNPRGPDSPFDPSEPNEKKRVHRGGSFLCNDQYCSRYIVGTRGKGEVNTGTNHLGFRCVKSAEAASVATK